MATDIDKAPEALQKLVADADTGGRKPQGLTRQIIFGVALAWALQQGYAVIPSSTRRANQVANHQSQGLTLTAHDIAHIATLDRVDRLASPYFAPQCDCAKRSACWLPRSGSRSIAINLIASGAL